MDRKISKMTAHTMQWNSYWLFMRKSDLIRPVVFILINWFILLLEKHSLYSLYFALRKQFSSTLSVPTFVDLASRLYALFMRFKRDLIRMLMFITCVNMSTATTNSNLKMTARFADHRMIIMNFNCTQTPARRGGRIYMIIRCHLEATSGQNLMEGRQMRKKGLNLNVSREFLKKTVANLSCFWKI